MSDRTPLNSDQLRKARRVAKITRGLSLPALLGSLTSTVLAIWTDRHIEWALTGGLLLAITAALLGLHSLAFDRIQNGEPRP